MKQYLYVLLGLLVANVVADGEPPAEEPASPVWISLMNAKQSAT